MENFVSLLRNMQGFLSTGGVHEQIIENAESALCLKFSLEYRSYLLELGSASYYGHELTGIISSPRINVVSVTMAEREFIHSVPDTWYVIERAGLDGIVIWQSTSGNVYQTTPAQAPLHIASSLAEYVIRF